jgi:hypothetical protein
MSSPTWASLRPDEAATKRMALQFQNSAHATKAQVAATEDWITAQGCAGVSDDDLRPALTRVRHLDGGCGEGAEAGRARHGHLGVQGQVAADGHRGARQGRSGQHRGAVEGWVCRSRTRTARPSRWRHHQGSGEDLLRSGRCCGRHHGGPVRAAEGADLRDRRGHRLQAAALRGGLRRVGAQRGAARAPAVRRLPAGRARPDGQRHAALVLREQGRAEGLRQGRRRGRGRRAEVGCQRRRRGRPPVRRIARPSEEGRRRGRHRRLRLPRAEQRAGPGQPRGLDVHRQHGDSGVAGSGVRLDASSGHGCGGSGCADRRAAEVEHEARLHGDCGWRCCDRVRRGRSLGCRHRHHRRCRARGLQRGEEHRQGVPVGPGGARQLRRPPADAEPGDGCLHQGDPRGRPRRGAEVGHPCHDEPDGHREP